MNPFARSALKGNSILCISIICTALSLSVDRWCKADPLLGTEPLTTKGDFVSMMESGMHRFLLDKTADSIQRRSVYWHRDLSSPERYAQSVAPNREHLAKILGVVDHRESFEAPDLLATTKQSALVGHGAGFDAYAIRWPVFGGIYGEGLLLIPKEKPAVSDVVAIPDADQTPEMLAGLMPGIAPESQFARRLAENGCRVVIPTIIDRSDTLTIFPSGQKSNQSEREFIYRPAFEMGRTIIGYESEKILAIVDWFARDDGDRCNIGVIGYGEGGLLALNCGAIDPRIKATCVSGYFTSRQNLWQEPIYRNVFDLLREFGDAEIASMIAPRALIVDACKGPEIDGPPPAKDGRRGAAPGKLVSPPVAEVKAEFQRLKQFFGANPSIDHSVLHVSGDDGQGPFATDPVLSDFLRALDDEKELEPPAAAPEFLRKDFDPLPRMKRQIDQMQAFTQQLVHDSPKVRQQFWSKADRTSLETWKTSTAWYRDNFANEVIGRFDDKFLSPHPRTRLIYDEPKFTGYEVMLDVYPNIFAYGILLIPKDLKPGERRPVVVCQHGLNGTVYDVADPKQDSHFYHRFACRLAEEGFITYAPQNPFSGEDQFRKLVRKANPLGKTLFSLIVPQHQQAVDWLATLPFVDPDRIAFYGLSYGGKTAMRVPALVDRYCLSICSGDFNEWIWKTTSLDFPSGYPGTHEYEMFEWNLGNTFNYSEIAGLIAPRPFMVERGHHDNVGSDEWVAYEYAKVRRLYSDLKIPDRTTIEFFDGPHTIHGVGTFAFLHEQLHWPEK